MGKRLNDNQRIATEHGAGPMLVLAGPGSGKTTVILCRLRKLLEEGQKGILIVTFTKAAATQMSERFGKHAGDRVLFATFHSIFFRILRRSYGYDMKQVFAEDEKRQALQKIILDKGWEVENIEEAVGNFITQASLLKNELAKLGEFIPEGIEPNLFFELYKAYEDYKARTNKIDFDDMLVQCYELLRTDANALRYWQNKFPYIMVDEFQDINRVQYECLILLAKETKNVFVVGDDDQSIYGFRGARPDFLFAFEKEYPDCQKVTLDVNYRSTDRILELAKRIIQVNENRYTKPLVGVAEEGRKVSFFIAEDISAEAEKIATSIAKLLEAGVPLDEIAIIYRTNIQGGAFARALHKKGIPYVLREGGGNIYDHWIARDLLAYLILAENADSDTAFRLIMNKPKRYIGKDLLAEATDMPYSLLRSLRICPSLKKYQAEALEGLDHDLYQITKKTPFEAVQYIRKIIGYDTYLEEYASFRRTSGQVLLDIADEIQETAREAEDFVAFRSLLEEMSAKMQKKAGKEAEISPKGITLSTMHGAKGLEFHAVFLPSLVDGSFPHERNTSNMEEERRLFYVAVTRAKERLWLSAVKHRYTKEAKPSIFLREVGLQVEKFYKKKE